MIVRSVNTSAGCNQSSLSTVHPTAVGIKHYSRAYRARTVRVRLYDRISNSARNNYQIDMLSCVRLRQRGKGAKAQMSTSPVYSFERCLPSSKNDTYFLIRLPHTLPQKCGQKSAEVTFHQVHCCTGLHGFAGASYADTSTDATNAHTAAANDKVISGSISSSHSISGSSKSSSSSSSIPFSSFFFTITALSIINS